MAEPGTATSVDARAGAADCAILDTGVLERQRAAFERGEPAVGAVVARLLAEAELALRAPPGSVMDKTETPPSGDKHDYLHPAPYWWPAETGARRRYVYRDGQRHPDTVMGSPGSARYDRTRLQQVMDHGLVLALAYRFTGEARYAEAAARRLRRWFLDPGTAMRPHLRYAQYVPGRAGGRGRHTGIIETKDLYFLLDGARLIEGSPAWTAADAEGLRAWCRAHLRWLLGSAQGRRERWSPNNHGTYYDLQVATLARFVGDDACLRRTLRRARRRLPVQIRGDGAQRLELRRRDALHYCSFNLQGWIHLARLAEGTGFDVWHARVLGASLEHAFAWLLAYRERAWPYRQTVAFDWARLEPLRFAASARYPALMAEDPDAAWTCTPRFDPHDGIRPYWQLGEPGL